MAMSVRQCQAVLCLALIQAVLRVSQLDFKWFLVGRVVCPCHLGVGWGVAHCNQWCSPAVFIFRDQHHVPETYVHFWTVKIYRTTIIQHLTSLGTKFPIFIDNSLNYSVAQVATFSCMIAIKVLIQLSLSLDARTVIQLSNHCSTHT